MAATASPVLADTSTRTPTTATAVPGGVPADRGVATGGVRDGVDDRGRDGEADPQTAVAAAAAAQSTSSEKGIDIGLSRGPPGPAGGDGRVPVAVMTSQDLWLELLDYGPGKRRIPRLIDMTVCDRSTCTKPATLLCSACRGRRYCSVECQKQHWRDEGHKKQCVPPTLMHCVMREDMVGCRALLAKTKDQEHKSVAAAPPPKAQEQVALTIEDGASKKKRPIIHYVMATNNRALLNLFVEHGADLQQQDTEGQTALQILKAHETTRAVKLQNPLASG